MAHSRQAWRGNNIGNQAKSIAEFDCNRLVCKDSGYSPARASREGILIKFHLQQIGHNSIGVNSDWGPGPGVLCPASYFHPQIGL